MTRVSETKTKPKLVNRNHFWGGHSAWERPKSDLKTLGGRGGGGGVHAENSYFSSFQHILSFQLYGGSITVYGIEKHFAVLNGNLLGNPWPTIGGQIDPNHFVEFSFPIFPSYRIILSPENLDFGPSKK